MAFKATQAWYAGAALGAVGVLAAGYMALVSPQLSNASDVTAQKDTVTAANAVTEGQIAMLKKQFSNLPDLEAKLASMRVHMPTSPQEPTLLRQLSAIAADTGVKLTGATFSAPQAMNAASATGGAAAVQTPGTLSQIGLNIQVTGSFAQTRAFLMRLETLPRFVLVTGVNVTRNGGSSSSSTGSGSSSSSSSSYALGTTISARTFMVGDQSGAAAAAASTTTTTAGGTTATAS
jgi:Tfp pilus assembly protein PilO